MMNNFTPRAQQVLALARREADRLNHSYVGSEHLCLGLVCLGQGVAVNVLQTMGIDLDTLRMEIEKQVRSGSPQKMVGNIPYTPRVKKIIALAGKEAKTLNHSYVGTEHIILGLLREGEGVAARVLKSLDVDIERTCNEILKELDPNYVSPVDEEESRPAQSPRLSYRTKSSKLPWFEILQAQSVLQGEGIEIKRGIGLALLPHSEPFDNLFTNVISPAFEANGLAATKADDIYKPGLTIAQVWDAIRRAEVIVADVSGKNPNVIYELGLCHAIQRCPILLVSDPEELPCNLRNLRYIEYEPTEEGAMTLKRGLTAAILEFLSAARTDGSGGTEDS